MTSWGAGRTRQGGPEHERDGKDEEGASSKTGRATFISGPTVCYPKRGFGDGVKGESMTGRTLKFFLGGESPSYGNIFLFFGLGLMWKKAAPALTVLSAVQFLIFMQQIGKGERKERRFLVKQKANLQLRQFSLRLFLLLGKWAGRLAVCIIHTHSHTHTRIHTCTDMQKHIGGACIHFCRLMHISTQSRCHSLWDVVCYSSNLLLGLYCSLGPSGSSLTCM